MIDFVKVFATWKTVLVEVFVTSVGFCNMAEVLGIILYIIKKIL